MIKFCDYTSILAENVDQQIATIQQQIAALEQRAAQANATLVKQRDVLKQRLIQLQKQSSQQPIMPQSSISQTQAQSPNDIST